MASDSRIPEQFNEVNIPLNWMTAPKEKVTLNIPEPVNERINQLAKELDMTKSLLFIVGAVLAIKLLADWIDQQ